jgi:serine/threonine protein kinase
MELDLNSSLGILDGRYILMKKLGEGYSSQVYKVKDSLSNKIYAAKVFNKYTQSIEKEIENNKKISQNIITEIPNFIKYITSSVGPFELKNYSQDSDISETKAYIIFELATKGELLDYITCTKENLDERFVKVIFIKIVKALRYLHNLGLCHRDLKTDNIVLSGEEFTIKLLDFGFSSKIIRTKDGRARHQTGVVGTKAYAAPEVLNGIPYDGEKADIFSLGGILFNIRTGFRGFKMAKCNNPYLTNKPTDLLYNYIRDKKQDTYWKILENSLDLNVNDLSEQFKKLYLKMVAYDPKERPTLCEIFNDDYFDDIRALTEDQLHALEQEIIAELKRREALIKQSKNLD